MQLYHATTTDLLPVILRDGLIPGSSADQFDTFGPQWHWPVALAHLYPSRPVYISCYEPVSWMPEWHADHGRESVLLRIDASGLRLLPDLPSLSDDDVSLTAEGLLLPSDWDEHERLSELDVLVSADRTISWAQVEANTDALIAVTDSAAISEHISPDRLTVLDWRRSWPDQWAHLPLL